jgi:cysteine-rich repeat protein
MRYPLGILILLISACGAPPSGGGGGDRPQSDAGPVGGSDTGVTPAVCGNGVVEEGEGCDDGNLEDGDGCDRQCVNEPADPLDDHGNTNNKATSLTLGAVQRGIFETADDVDVFGFNIAVAADYELAIDGQGTIACALKDASDNTLAEESAAGGCTLNGALEAGRYYLALSLDSGDIPSSYSVLLSEDEGGGQNGSCGDGIRDFGEGCDDGNTEAGDGCDPNCQPELGDDAQGNTREEAAAIALGQATPAAINEGGDFDYYAFTTEAAGEYQIETSGDTDVYCHLEDAVGEEIETDDDSGEGMNCQIIIELTANTGYFVKVRGFSETRVGAYSLTISYLVPPVCGNGQVERGESCDDGNVADGDGCDSACSIEDDFGNDAAHAHGIADPSQTDANLLAEDEDFFRFTAAASSERQIHTVSTIDTYCHLFDDQGNELATNDDDGERTNCKIVHQLVAGQSYVIKVRGFSTRTTGDYTLHVGPVVAE